MTCRKFRLRFSRYVCSIHDNNLQVCENISKNKVSSNTRSRYVLRKTWMKFGATLEALPKNYWLALHTERTDLQHQHKMQQNCSKCIHLRKVYLICKTDREATVNFVNWYLRGKHDIETHTTIVLPGGAVLFRFGGFVTCHSNRFPS